MWLTLCYSWCAHRMWRILYLFTRWCDMFFWIHGVVDPQRKRRRTGSLAVRDLTDQRWPPTNTWNINAKCNLNIRFPPPQVSFASLDDLNLQLSACGFSLHKDSNNFLFRASYSGCSVQHQVVTVFSSLLAQILTFAAKLHQWHIPGSHSARIPCTCAELEEDKPLQKQVSKAYNEVSRGFCTAMQRANPMRPRVYPGKNVKSVIFEPFQSEILISFLSVIRWPEKLPMSTGEMRYWLYFYKY